MKKLLVFILFTVAIISTATSTTINSTEKCADKGKIQILSKGSDEYQLTLEGNFWSCSPYDSSRVEWILFCESKDTFIVSDTVNVKVQGLLYIACRTRYFYRNTSWFLSAINQCLKGPEPDNSCFQVLEQEVITTTPPTPVPLSWNIVNGCITPNQNAALVFWYDHDPLHFEVTDLKEGETHCFNPGIVNFYFVTFNEVTEVYKIIIP